MNRYEILSKVNRAFVLEDVTNQQPNISQTTSFFHIFKPKTKALHIYGKAARELVHPSNESQNDTSLSNLSFNILNESVDKLLDSTNSTSNDSLSFSPVSDFQLISDSIHSFSSDDDLSWIQIDSLDSPKDSQQSLQKTSIENKTEAIENTYKSQAISEIPISTQHIIQPCSLSLLFPKQHRKYKFVRMQLEVDLNKIYLLNNIFTKNKLLALFNFL
ncbi:hypothetical protein WA158_004040 [Blastocystis sp. Blastoise]